MKTMLNQIRLVLALIILLTPKLCSARECGQPNQCNAFTNDCDRVVEYMTWAQFQEWLNNNNKQFTILWSSSANVRFVHESNCVYQTVCWDSQGECTP